MEGLTWKLATLGELSPQEVVELFTLRSIVFVVEQECVYQDPDEADRHPATVHLLARDRSGDLLGYARVLAPGIDGAEPVIGRVVTASSARGQGLGNALVNQCLQVIESRWPGHAVRLHAQTYLLGFYRGHGFEPQAEPYLLDGIEHQEMLRAHSSEH